MCRSESHRSRVICPWVRLSVMSLDPSPSCPCLPGVPSHARRLSAQIHHSHEPLEVSPHGPAPAALRAKDSSFHGRSADASQWKDPLVHIEGQ